MVLSTIFLYLIRVEIIQESQELQSTTHLGKEVQDSKGANTCPFIFFEKFPFLFKRLIVETEIPSNSETSLIVKKGRFS